MTLQEVVGKISPLVSAAVGAFIPGGSLIVSGLAHLFGVDGASQDTLAQTIAADPDAAVKIKQFELEHQDILAKMTQADRASARDMNIAMINRVGKSDYMLHFLAFFVFGLLACYILIGYFFPGEFDKGVMHDLINIAMLPLSFYYGGMYVQARQAQLGNANINLPPPAQTR